MDLSIFSLSEVPSNSKYLTFVPAIREVSEKDRHDPESKKLRSKTELRDIQEQRKKIIETERFVVFRTQRTFLICSKITPRTLF